MIRILKLLLILVLLSMPAYGGPRIDLSEKEIDCLAKMVFHESRGEGRQGMIAVAYVAINRAEHSSEIYGKTICEVVRKPYQFEGMKKENTPIREVAAWRESYEVSVLTLSGMVKDPTQGALYFHAKYIKPSWAYVKKQTYDLGGHIFYK
jgi:spore germination cell wall hydrolase CwlJ-like protein